MDRSLDVRELARHTRWVPIPADPAGRADLASTVLALLTQTHAGYRAEIIGLNDETLNWSPGPGYNSIALLVVHSVGSEAETLRSVAGIPGVRDREAEFQPKTYALSQCLALLEEADQLIDELSPLLDEARLGQFCSLPTLSQRERRSGRTWLIGTYGHAREHLGHVQITKQLALGVRG
jgi:hypothetical protein